MWDKHWDSLFSIPLSNCSSTTCRSNYYFPILLCQHFCQNPITMYVSVYFELFILFCSSICLFLCQDYVLFISIALNWVFISGSEIFQICFSSLELFWLFYDIYIAIQISQSFVEFYKINSSGIFIGPVLNL